MENNTDTNQSNQTQQMPKIVTDRSAAGGKKWVTWLLVLLLVLSLGANGYLWMQLQKAQKDANALRTTNSQLASTITELQQKVQGEADETDETACTYMPANTMKDNIKAALDSKNTAAFSTYTTDPVKYILAASEYAGDISPDEAATSLDYTHSATGPWEYVDDFSDYATGDYDDYFGDNTLVIKADSGMVVAFEFNCDGSKISDIFVAASEDLL